MFLAFFISFPICRYKKFYSTDSNAWGEFQHHRRVVGVICLARADQTTSTTSTGDATTAKTSDVSKLCRLHDDIRTQFDDSVFDSRLFLFRSPTSGHVTTTTTNACGSVDSVQAENTIETSQESSQDKNSVVAQANSIDQSGASTSSEDDVTSSQVDVGNSSNNNVQSKRSTSPMASSSRDSGFTEDSPGATTCSNSSHNDSVTSASDTVTSTSDAVTSAGSGSQAEDILPPYVVCLDDVDQTGDFDGKFNCKLCYSHIYCNILRKGKNQANAASMDVRLLLSTRVIKTCFC